MGEKNPKNEGRLWVPMVVSDGKMEILSSFQPPNDPGGALLCEEWPVPSLNEQCFLMFFFYTPSLGSLSQWLTGLNFWGFHI